MSKRFACLFGLGVLVSLAVLVACGTNYNSSSDGLVLVSSQGSGLLETFSFSLASGHIAAISNPPVDTANETCVLNGLPAAITLDPAGKYAYTIISSSPNCGSGKTPGIQAFKVSSDGTISPSGSLIPLNQATVEVCRTASNTFFQESVPVVPLAMTIDSSGKFLFIADSFTTDPSGNAAPGSISVFSIGTGGSLTEVTNSPFTVPPSCTATADFSSIAVTPTVFPSTGITGTQNAVCSDVGNHPPTSEYLYATDRSNNNAVWEFHVDTSTGALTPQGTYSQPQSIPAGAVPLGVAVDPCDRFVYVTNSQSNTVSGYTICNGLPTQSSQCPATPDGSLRAIANSPFSLAGGANGPGPLVVDPFGRNVYVLDTLSNQVSPFTISAVSGSLVAGSLVVTGIQPTSIAIRADDAWLFVANFNGQTLSQYSIVPATGVLSALPAVGTDNYPFGVAVK